jgi:SAM-dependent methyltransferase
MSTWYESWFESPWYMRLYRHRTEEEAHEAIELVTHHANVPKGSRILDLACGYGRHALVLAEAGYHVTGLDASHFLIRRAEEVFPHPNVNYVVGDMRGPFPHAPYDAIVNFFTSFGYFDTPEEDAKVLHAVHDALVGGGQFIMDFLNARFVTEHLVAESMSLVENATIIQDRRIADGFVHKHISINIPCSHELEFDERVRLYTCDELVAMITAAGMTVDRILGNYDGASFVEETSARCIIIAHRTSQSSE